MSDLFGATVKKKECKACANLGKCTEVWLMDRATNKAQVPTSFVATHCPVCGAPVQKKEVKR